MTAVRMMFLTAAMALSPVLGADLAAAQAAGGWETYRNARFGYAISYPPTLLVPGPEAMNGDGRGFRSPDRQTAMLVFGRLLQPGETLASIYGDAEKRFGADRITYKVRKRTWFVLSGFVADQLIFYKAGMIYTAPPGSLTPGARIYASFELSWPETRRAVVDKKVGRILRSFLRSTRQ